MDTISLFSLPARRTLRAGLAVAALIGLTISCRNPRTPPAAIGLLAGLLPSQAQVAEVRGVGARGKSPGGSWRKLQLGDWLPMGSVIQTPPNSTLTLRLYEAGVLLVAKPGSNLRLEKLSYRKEPFGAVTATVIDLQKGEVVVDGANLPAGSEFEIRTPQGVTRIPPRNAR